jgi:dihydrofolate reductase
MRKVVLYELMSADGVVENPNSFLFDFDQEMDDHLGEVIGSQDTVLLGREMYDEWSEYWPSSDIQPFADFINSVEKFVATSSPLVGSWPNATAIEGPVDAFVRTLKAGEGGDIGVHGSITLARSLLAAGVVDEVVLVVAPTLSGSGRRLVESAEAFTRLEPLSVGTSPSGALLVHYRVAGHVRP